MNDWDGETTAHAAEGPQWVSAAEAADAAGVTPGTVRYWARNGLIVSEVVAGPAGERTLVRLDEVLRHARQDTGGDPGAPPGRPGGAGGVVTDLPARTSELAPILKSIPEIMAQLTAATDRAARAETKVEFLSAQLAEMRRRLAEAEAGRSAPAEAVVPETWEVPPPAGAPRDEPGFGASWSDPEPAPPPPSLDEIWATPPRRDAAPPADEVHWHEPAAASAAPSDEREEASGRPARRANADIPDEAFPGPRRRRWFRRRR